MEIKERQLMEIDVHKQLDLLPNMSRQELMLLWHNLFKRSVPSQLRRELLIRILAYRMQEAAFGGLSKAAVVRLRQLAKTLKEDPRASIADVPRIKPGTRLIRSWQGQIHQVTVTDKGYEYKGRRYGSLSETARLITGTRWSGPLFFGLRNGRGKDRANGR